MTDALGRSQLTRRQAILWLIALAVPATACTLLVWVFLPHWWPLSAYFWYSIPGNSFILLPHEPAVIFAGTLYSPLWVALVGGLATIPASAIDHQLFSRAFRLKRLAQVRDTRLFRLTARAFAVQPWWTIFVFAFSPIPFYPIRIAAPMYEYPATRYVTAVLVGRVPRYYLLAWGGDQAARFLSWSF